MNIPTSILEPFGYTGIPVLSRDDPNFDRDQLWIDMCKAYNIIFLQFRGSNYDFIWEKAARACGAEWARAYENATPNGEMILNVKMPNVKCTQVYTFHPTPILDEPRISRGYAMKTSI